MHRKKHNLKKTISNNGENYEIEQLDENHISICGQNIFIKDKTETVTINYVHSLMSGFQFRKTKKYLEYRWFNINTINRHIINGEWRNL